jgi:hypothetical protein
MTEVEQMGAILHDAIHTCRKPRTCDQCGKRIQVGERYRKQVHTYDGLVTYRAHEDCDKAAEELRKMADLNPDEAYILCEYGDEDKAFLKEKYPAVAARMFRDEAA